jgi:hypothetical protein
LKKRHENPTNNPGIPAIAILRIFDGPEGTWGTTGVSTKKAEGLLSLS